jgi:hypothetical protein
MQTLSVSDWSELQDEMWPNALLGNGLSSSFSDRFRYASLYDRASSESIDHPLNDADRAVFDAFETTNFETVLSALATTGLVLRAWSADDATVRERYESIRNALVETVRDVHPGQGGFLLMLPRLQSALSGFSHVFTTSYDLLIYWSIMQGQVPLWHFNDYFRTASCDVEGDWVCFERAGAERLEGSTNLLYLHGALHLYEMPWGQTVKVVSSETGGLLDRFGQSSMGSHDLVAPLFVSEGTAAQKRRAIRQSDYLSFCFDRLSAIDGNVVVFGHALSDSDSHILQAMSAWSPRSIAIAVGPHQNPAVLYGRLAPSLQHHNVQLYDYASHPLGELGTPMGRRIGS